MVWMVLTNAELLQFICLPVEVGLLAFGGGVCIYYRRLSAWLKLTAAGFFGLASAEVVNVFLIHPLINWLVIPTPFDLAAWYFFAISLLFSLGYALIVAGFALSLGEITRKASWQCPSSDANKPFRFPETGESWQARNEGSQDIQR